ncbi:serine hydrolase domain-containing protein [Cryobacterium fucosi]|uniref:Class A beta-lactamase-related serine hydrolase n=1 Tax=Cryobacterium fucosi TaxID=1259157 RepID=A0A4R9AYY6_9MICO|nr:serine hydrolase domain-containing protein [Cryobacterium fucosi]TFD72855.1 class A beta-lactamase-related serine hydrolase [Cryobacterium fucosi]
MTFDLIAQLDPHFEKVTRARGLLGAPQVLVTAPGLRYQFGDPLAPFHAASIGKVATAVLVMQLVESGTLSLESPLTTLLPANELTHLFSGDGSSRATVHQLLTHTAGVADYFAGPVRTGPSFMRLVVDEPERVWSPADLLDFSRHHQSPVAAPGARFSYSDTGYVLLGRILEELTGQPFHDLLHERIFTPLDLANSWLVSRSAPADPNTPELAPFWLDRVEASRFASVSCDWAGGGIAATPANLVTLSEALHNGALLAPESLAYLSEMRHRFRAGIHYGAGFMELRFEGFFFALRGLPRPLGHIGVLGTHMFYDPRHDAHVVLNFHSTREMVRSFKSLIRIEQALGRASAG